MVLILELRSVRRFFITSNWSYFSQESDRLETVFLKLKYPEHLLNLALKQFVDSQVADQQQHISLTGTITHRIRVFIAFKDLGAFSRKTR